VIPSVKSRWFCRWFSGHAGKRIEGTFGRVLVAGLAEAREAVSGGPVLFVVNHTTWWDALVILWLAHVVLGSDGYAMMDASNLRRLPFFRRVGAFGVDLADPSDGARGIRYAARLLDRPGRTLWIFPEGRERSPFASLELLPGSAQIARVARSATVVPVALRYVFTEAERPELYIAFGGALEKLRAVPEILAAQRSGIERELARIDAALAKRDEASALGFEVVHARGPGFFARLAERMLVRLLP
jgi:1-acyl-sn-glycerol-3-phosphate acyltransferase